MRLIAAIMTLVTLAAAGLAGQQLYETVNVPEAALDVAALTQTNSAEPQPPTPAAPSQRWPALFGEVQPPLPKAPEIIAETPTPAQEPQPPKPPVSSLGYSITGLVDLGDSAMAMVSHPTGNKLMRVGDDLADGVIIKRIDEAGLWVDNGADKLELLAYSKE